MEEAFLFRQSISPKLQADWQFASEVVTAAVGTIHASARVFRIAIVATYSAFGQPLKK